MLTKYIESAMNHAHYEVMEKGRYFGSIAKCKGTWAEAHTLEECRESLQGVLEDWILLGLQMGHRLPIIDGINLNRKSARKPTHAETH